MAGQPLLGLVAVLGAFICAGAFTWALGGVVRERTAASRVQQESGSGSVGRRLARNGVRVFEPVGKRALRLPVYRRWCEQLAAALADAGYASSADAASTLGVAVVAACLVAGAVARSPIGGLAAAGACLVAASALSSKAAERRADAIRDALPDAMRTMSACFHTGFSLQQTFAQLAHETEGPLGAVFARVGRELQAGCAAQEALERMRRTAAVGELSFVSVALEVQHRAGGSMQHVLDSTCESLESELELRRSLRVQTAQARMSARVVVGVTIALVAVLTLISEGFLAPFFASALGMGVLALAVIMQVAGIVLVRRMLNVEVD